jgi:hypothetical protein
MFLVTIQEIEDLRTCTENPHVGSSNRFFGMIICRPIGKLEKPKKQK